MKRNSNTSIIPKIIVILGTLSIVGIILLFLRPRPEAPVRIKQGNTPEKLFAQVIEAARPQVLKLWEKGDDFFPADGVKCNQEILHHKMVGRSYYQCNPHFWQCYWQGGVTDKTSFKIELFGRDFHVTASANENQRYFDLYYRTKPGLKLQYGYLVELQVREIPGLTQPMILADTCRDTYLPQRIYGYGRVENRLKDGFIWDNFGRDIFIDRFYVTNRQVNEWYRLSRQEEKIVNDPAKWPLPAPLSKEEQKLYCSFYGKRLLEAKLFDAATMSPAELKNPLPDKVYRPDTPWQRDLNKTFLGMARVNPDYQLTPLDCQLAQVQGCGESYFSTDSATWMGLNFALGYYPESLENFIEPEKNLKKSSRFLAASSNWHLLGKLGHWTGKQVSTEPVAFRCYEEVVP